MFNKNPSESFIEPHVPNQKTSEEENHPIPSYIPHNKALLGKSGPMKPGEHGSSTFSTPIYNHQYSNQKNKQGGYGDMDLGNDLLSVDLCEHNDVFETNQKKDEGSLKSREDYGYIQNPTLKKLILSNEERSKLLDWSTTKPRPPVKEMSGQTSSHVNNDPGREVENKGKSAFTILSNAIKRSFTRSISSAPDNPKNISSSKTNPVSAGSYLDIPGSIFRRSHSHSESFGKPNNTEMTYMSNHLPHHDFKASTGGSSGFASSQRPKQDSSKVEDMPKMLEKFSIRENNPSSSSTDLPFRNRKGSIFSSLRLTNKTNETRSNAPSNDSWYTPWSFLKKANEKEAEPRPRGNSTAASNLQVMTQRDAKGFRGTKSENYSTSSDEESTRRRSSSFKTTRASKQQRKMEKEARLRAKQEELKRLHKAQVRAKRTKELELEDQQGRLEQKPALKDEKDIAEEEEVFAEMMRVIEKRDQLVTRIEEQRLRENSEEKNLLDVPLPIEGHLKVPNFSNRSFS
ncbi:hypothetical protein GDO81_024783 [Engystomops pustulosus]|uniref:BMERB domain-containing protein n=1 Tax=Engystomops pustulosus TaxID=76066 RepID=A0AAV6ZH11_ENGPU|nr:hypothetical protein GDO81_024783 [Engystomops pustulosus]